MNQQSENRNERLHTNTPPNEVFEITEITHENHCWYIVIFTRLVHNRENIVRNKTAGDVLCAGRQLPKTETRDV